MCNFTLKWTKITFHVHYLIFGGTATLRISICAEQVTETYGEGENADTSLYWHPTKDIMVHWFYHVFTHSQVLQPLKFCISLSGQPWNIIHLNCSFHRVIPHRLPAKHTEKPPCVCLYRVSGTQCASCFHHIIVINGSPPASAYLFTRMPHSLTLDCIIHCKTFLRTPSSAHC